MKRLSSFFFVILLFVLMGINLLRGTRADASARTPESTLRAFFDRVKARDIGGAYSMVSTKSNIDQGAFQRDVTGSNGSLKTFSALGNVDTRVLRESDHEAEIRADLTWSTAVGALKETRDFKLVSDDGQWKIFWDAPKEIAAPPQVVPVNYLRWDIIRRGSEDDWGAQNVEAPRVRIVSMNAVEKEGNVIIIGEVVNEDTVPGFVTVNAVLIGKDGNPLKEESSFDKISHTLLPKEVSPFRIDFPKTRLADIKSVRIDPTTLLVPASADPVISVLNQRVEKDGSGHNVLRGELVNQSGQTVNIPHVLATYYDNSGKVIWVSDAYVDRALLPQTPIPFSVEVRDDLAPQVHSYRVTVNHYTIDRT
ncbi:MAG TPA: hypothetical protein VMZ25_08850 [Terriglobales bacterium]|nr:hypothetical protein [Terriglobales bacterium]